MELQSSQKHNPGFNHKLLKICNNTQLHAKNIGLAAYKKYMQGIKYSSDSVVPEYLKPSGAERAKQKKL